MSLLTVTATDGSTAYYPSTLATAAPPAAAPPATGRIQGAAATAAPGAATRTETMVFKATTGPVVFESEGQAEVYDGRILANLGRWTLPGYSHNHSHSHIDSHSNSHDHGANGAKASLTQHWLQPAQWVAATRPAISPRTLGARVVSHKITITTDTSYAPISITTPVPSLPDTQVVDFGQNIAGQVELRVTDCPAGTVISMQHTEVLYPNGLAHNQFCERSVLHWVSALLARTQSGGPVRACVRACVRVL